MTDERFALLVEAHLEGRLTDAEAGELVAAVEGSPELRARLLEAVSMAGLLAKAHAPPDLSDRVQAGLRDRAAKADLVRNVIHRLPSRRRGPSRWAWAAAALLAVGLSALLLRPDRPAAPAPRPVRHDTEFRDWKALEAAVARGVAYLRAAKLPHNTWQAPLPCDDLVLLALLSAGVPKDDPFVRELLDRALAAPLRRVYTAALHAQVLRRLDDPRHRERLADCARFLVENQEAAGNWAYGVNKEIPEKPGAKVGSSQANNSTTLFAAMGLEACAAAGIEIPRQTLEKAAAWWRSCQRPDRDVQFGAGRAGWCYSREEKDHHPYGSMTAGGLSALVALDRLLGIDPAGDAAVGRAREWLTYHFTVLENYGPVEDLMAQEILSDTPNPMTEYFYYMMFLERCAALLGESRFGPYDWFAAGARELLDLQDPKGFWYSRAKRCQPVYDTCYAILFLTRWSHPPEVR